MPRKDFEFWRLCSLELDCCISGEAPTDFTDKDSMMVTKEQDEHYARCVETALEMKAKRDADATELFERKARFNSLEEILEALQKGIYGD